MTNFAAVFLRLAALALPLAALGVVAADLSPPPAGLAGRCARAGHLGAGAGFEPAATGGDSRAGRRAGARRCWPISSRCRGGRRFPSSARRGGSPRCDKPHRRDADARESLLPARGTSRSATACRTNCGPSRRSSRCRWTAAAGRCSRYVLRPRRRGAFEIERVFLLARSRLGLWQRLLDYPLATTIHVYPDLQQLDQYALLARTNRLSLLGVRRTRRIGQDHEFERLRDYTVDDNHKRIDWRATARRNKLTVRDYQATQCQQIVFLIDGGRLMTNESAGLTLLDHSLNAMLMLSYVALRQGDQVGLVHFADDIDCFVPPRGGMRQMNRLLHASFDRFPRLVETRYDHAFRYLNAHCRKRSLVVLVTSIIDEVNAAEFDRYLSNLVGRHLPLAVLLRDHRLFDAVAPEQPDAQQLWRYAAAADIIAWRHQVLTDLHSKGVLSVDVFPEQMTAPLVNRYLEIKARHLL